MAQNLSIDFTAFWAEAYPDVVKATNKLMVTKIDRYFW